MESITPQKIRKMSYVELMAFLGEVNRPPGGKNSIRRAAQNCFLTKNSKVLDVGCNTGYCSFEIAHLVKCRVIGIDISPIMIRTAKKFQQMDLLGGLIEFKTGDATNLPFKDSTFDLVISGGSTAFINDKEKALEEYRRVVKPWGFIADINFFYRIKPPLRLLKMLNDLMGTNIQPWTISYWLNLYNKCGLEQYFVYTNKIKRVSAKKVKNYCKEMVRNKRIFKESEKELKRRLLSIMNLFNKNHRYLSYGVFILRKRPIEEQISLFGA